MKISPADTIAAVATPPGEGALAVIRISGPQSLQIGDRIFGTQTGCRRPGVHSHHGTIVNQAGQDVDEVLAAVFRVRARTRGKMRLRSAATGSLCHQRCVERCACGRRKKGRAGRFTRRAYLNGKMDFRAPRTVAALISSEANARTVRLSNSLRGRLAGTVEEMKSGLKRLCALLEVDLISVRRDKPDRKPEIDRKIKEAKENLSGWRRRSRRRITGTESPL